MRPQAGRTGLRKYEEERGVELYAVLPFPSISHNYPLQGSPGGGPATKAVECSGIWTLESDNIEVESKLGYPTCWLCDFPQITTLSCTSVS